MTYATPQHPELHVWLGSRLPKSYWAMPTYQPPSDTPTFRWMINLKRWKAVKPLMFSLLLRIDEKLTG